MDHVMMVADEVVKHLQNGHHSEKEASIQPDVGGNVKRDGISETEPSIATEDSANEECGDRQESSSTASDSQSIGDVQMNGIDCLYTPFPDGEDQERKDDATNIDYVPVLHACLATATVVTSKVDDSTEKLEKVEESRPLIDTDAPFESVKEAVSMFGGIADWKARKLRAVERQKFVEQELENMREEIPKYKEMAEIAEEEKLRVLKELESTKRLIEELKLNLEREQTEEHQQDSEFAILRVEEMEQGIADEASVTLISQLEVAKTRHTDAVTELKSVKEELDKTRNEYGTLLKERDVAFKKSEEAVAALKEVESKVEELTIEMLAAKEYLESAQVGHVEAEEHRTGAAMEKEQDSLTWETELKQAEEELTVLEIRIQTDNGLKSNLDSASALLIELKGKLTAYIESKLKQEVEEKQALSGEGAEEESEKRISDDQHLAVVLAKKELKEVELNIEKVTAKVGSLKVAAASLQSELEKERSSLTAVRQREGIASVTVTSLKDNLKSIRSDIEMARTNEKEVKERIAELPKPLQHVAQEADRSKLLVQLAREELRKAEEEAELEKTAASTMVSRLLATQKEIEAAKASEYLALADIKALRESESMHRVSDKDSSSFVTLSVEKYYELSKRAHEAEKDANTRVEAAFSQVEIAQLSEMRSQAQLEELTKERVMRKKKLETAKEKAEKAKEEKLGVEDELRKWRAESELRRKAKESSIQTPGHPVWSQARSFVESREFETNAGATATKDANYSSSKTPHIHESYSKNEPSTNVKIGKKKKRIWLFTRIFMFLTRRRSQPSKSR